MKNVIEQPGQSWKIKIALSVFILSGISMFYGLFSIETLSSISFFYFVAGGALVGLFTFILACASIKCPSCGSKWIWSAISRTNDKAWLFWLNSLSSCPKCGKPKNE